jgi:hypothetical protein
MHSPKSRHTIFALMNEVRYLIENFYKDIVELKLGEKYNGKFDITLNQQSRVSIRAFNRIATNGASVKFWPNDPDGSAAMKALEGKDGSLNLSTLHTNKELGESLGEEDLSALKAMMKDVFAVLHEKGVSPIHQLVSEAQRKVGYGPLKISKHFGGEDTSVQDDPELFAKIMQKTVEMLNDKVTLA